ncbi:hypothetical protein PoB_004991000 [Plakobranchus ocellatus]|uniref:Uncharacterized protein n=1 Tax=Plakobranchus ocellatus TaxID=259542 RepID=A0AAV4BVP3_9GAST|nr:hypothetical protein PoB_004991000 [Plakobranchus ocellatus]
MATANPTAEAQEKQTGPVMYRNTEEKTPTVKTRLGEYGAPNLEGAFFKNFVDPMTQELEKNVAQTNALLDKISSDLEAERKQRFRKILSSHIPEALQGGGKKEEDVMQLVDQLIFYEEVGDAQEEVQIK